jgi:hypothetical protein
LPIWRYGVPICEIVGFAARDPDRDGCLLKRPSQVPGALVADSLESCSQEDPGATAWTALAHQFGTLSRPLPRGKSRRVGCACACFERPWLSQRILKASALGAAPKLPAKSVVGHCRSVLPDHGVVQVLQLSNAGTKKRGLRGIQCCSCTRPPSTHAGAGAQYVASWRGTLCGLSREMCRSSCAYICGSS